MKDYQAILFPYAYNILGSFEDARDAVQDVLYKHLSAQQKEVDNEKAYLIKAVINQSINIKEKNKRMRYGDEWLPEPIATAAGKITEINNVLDPQKLKGLKPGPDWTRSFLPGH